MSCTEQCLSIQVDRDGDVHLVSIAGSIDMATAPDLLGLLSELNGHAIAIDLTAVEFIDSTGVHFLLETHRNAESLRLVVARPGPAYRLLELTGLLDVFDVVVNDGTSARLIR